MMNAAMKVFAENGYENACTDVIVKEAGISKGLLFHYFISKAGLFEFIANYGMRYVKLEFSAVNISVDDSLFRSLRSVAMAKTQVMKQYPYVFLFLKKALRESKEVIGEENFTAVHEFAAYLEQLYLAGRSYEELQAEDKRAYKLAMYADAGAMERDLYEGRADGSLYYLEIMEICDMLR